MKKILTILVAVLAGLFVILSLLDLKGDYRVEQLVWSNNQKLAVAAKNQETTSEKTFESIAANYRKIIKSFPNSRLVPGINLLLGQTYVAGKSFDKARQVFAETCKKYPDNKALCSEALVLTGKTYQEEKNVSMAVKTFEQIMRQYPLTDGGLMMPLYIAKYHQFNNHGQAAALAYTQAIAHYKKIISENQNSVIEFKALGLLAGAYSDIEQWQPAMETFGESLLKYPDPRTAGVIFKSINFISLVKLQNKDAAIKLYQNILKEKPSHPLAKVIEKMIKSLETLKDADAKVFLKN
ncbi:MAG TPA: tetratricopeptide repeat protein [Candidatus Omnitrophota bacterium]|nr:tetratricopeptide repeat protein [Candidatus Omnitrophota bacterium]HPD85204.1 tetratricopeptide repeat protein [Candidatus Omnitrophota bacterium]HRZ04295.1 tetratricopeptide repeat protein [Candidatus Omnitrophota bacterium]